MSLSPADVHAIVREAGGAELLDRLLHLESLPDRTRPSEVAPPLPEPGARTDFDVVMAGGGLWSLLAPLLAQSGLSVAVVERARAGESHREWNASRAELGALVTTGLVSEDELSELIVASYDHGTCRFAAGGEWPVRGVLDHAVDAQGLLTRARAMGEAMGITYLDGHAALGHAASDDAVRLRVRERDRDRDVTARVLVDARGAASPFATADLVCPTVGGVVEGLTTGAGPDTVDPRVGDILATTEGIDDGRQHVWEAFPGRPGQTTVYLFYYARAKDRGSLLSLYARFFTRLPTYKKGTARLVRPTFGLIPGWSRLSPPPRAPHRRVVLVGDAAARHSPLTYCGFGATLRSLGRARDAVVRTAAGEPTPLCAVDDAPTHALTGALAHLMTNPTFRGGALNELLAAAFETLHEMGNDAYAALLQDRMSTADFVTFLRRTAGRHPAVWGKVMRGLGPFAAGRWGLGLARSMMHAP